MAKKIKKNSTNLDRREIIKGLAGVPVAGFSCKPMAEGSQR